MTQDCLGTVAPRCSFTGSITDKRHFGEIDLRLFGTSILPTARNNTHGLESASFQLNQVKRNRNHQQQRRPLTSHKKSFACRQSYTNYFDIPYEHVTNSLSSNVSRSIDESRHEARLPKVRSQQIEEDAQNGHAEKLSTPPKASPFLVHIHAHSPAPAKRPGLSSDLVLQARHANVPARRTDGCASTRGL